MDYNALHAGRANDRMPVLGKRVLVVGCGGGRDCSYFVDFGASYVHGLDISEKIGGGFRHDRVTYHRASVHAIPLSDNSVDVVYCFATMEHVSDIEAGYHEMSRLCAPGGIVYCVAAPLWNSYMGHHKPQFFADYPWIHLRLSQEQIMEYCEESGLCAQYGAGEMRAHVSYMLNDKYFNKESSWLYLRICDNLRSMETIENRVNYRGEKTLSDEVFAELEPRGHDRKDLLGATHTYVGRKR